MSSVGAPPKGLSRTLTRDERKELFRLLVPGADHDLLFDDVIGDAVELALETISPREARHRLLAPCLVAYVRNGKDAEAAARSLGVEPGLCRRNVTYALRNLRNRCPVARCIRDNYVCDFGTRSRRGHRYGRCNACRRTRRDIAASGDRLCPAKRARPRPPLAVKQAKPHAPNITSPLAGADTPAEICARFTELASAPDADRPRLARAAVNKLRLILRDDPGDLNALLTLALFIARTGVEAHYGYRNVLGLVGDAGPDLAEARWRLLALGADPDDPHAARLLRELALGVRADGVHVPETSRERERAERKIAAANVPD